MMRLNFSTTNLMNTDVMDERGCIYYTISTPTASKKVTKITKYRRNGGNGPGVPEMMGVIEWHWLKPTMIRFNGKEMTVEEMLERRSWETGRYFVGPDRKTYKWKLESTHCWMKDVDSGTQLVRFHKQNLGIRKAPHPAYLQVSLEVASMLDHIILTFVYVEWLREEQRNSHTAWGGMMLGSASGSGMTTLASISEIEVLTG